jgi:hypothetical protein
MERSGTAQSALASEASLEDLGAEELARLGELAILPEDENVPLRSSKDSGRKAAEWTRTNRTISSADFTHFRCLKA